MFFTFIDIPALRIWKKDSISQHLNLELILLQQRPSIPSFQSISSVINLLFRLFDRLVLEYIANVYVTMRQENQDHKRAHTYTTPRTLMSVLRLSQALARLQFREEVNVNDIEEALRLMKMSKISLKGKLFSSLELLFNQYHDS